MGARRVQDIDGQECHLEEDVAALSFGRQVVHCGARVRTALHNKAGKAGLWSGLPAMLSIGWHLASGLAEYPKTAD